MRVQRVFPDRDAGRQQNRDRFSHIADFCVRNDALLERLEFRQRLQSHCDAGRAARHVPRGDDRMDAHDPEGRRGVDRSDAAVGDGAAQDHRME